MSRTVFWSVFAVAFVSLAPLFGQTTDMVEESPSSTLELRGTIGAHLAVHMHLEVRNVIRRQDGDSFVVGEQYRGYYYYDKRGQHIELRGYFNAQGMDGAADEPEVEIGEFVDGKKTAVFIGQLTETEFKGQWQSFERARTLPFALRVTRKR